MKSNIKYRIYKKCIIMCKWLLFIVVAFFILFPVYWIFISSITPAGELFKKPIDYYRIILHLTVINFSLKM